MVELSRGDRFLGIGLGMGDGRKGDSSKWEGQNALRRVLMQLRKYLWMGGDYSSIYKCARKLERLDVATYKGHILDVYRYGCTPSDLKIEIRLVKLYLHLFKIQLEAFDTS